MSTDLWFPEAGTTPSPVAKAVCAGCEVRAACLEAALENRERYGLWGGLSETARRAILRGRFGPQPANARGPSPVTEHHDPPSDGASHRGGPHTPSGHSDGPQPVPVAPWATGWPCVGRLVELHPVAGAIEANRGRRCGACATLLWDPNNEAAGPHSIEACEWNIAYNQRTDPVGRRRPLAGPGAPDLSTEGF